MGDGYSRINKWAHLLNLHKSRLDDALIYRPSKVAGLEPERIFFRTFVLGGSICAKLVSYYEIAKYFTIWMWYFFRLQWCVLRCGTEPNVSCCCVNHQSLWNELAKPFHQWCDERGLNAVKRFSLRSLTVMMYGRIDQVPTLYGKSCSCTHVASSCHRL